ncbi:hypothetical protein QQ045_012672 [Rhodiola kirilowii]
MRIKAVVEELKDELPSVRVLGEARALQSRVPNSRLELTVTSFGFRAQLAIQNNSLKSHRRQYLLIYLCDLCLLMIQFSLKFVATNRTVVKGITSLNSKFFHMAVVACKDFKGSEIRIVAPEDSPNTDGIHVERSSGVYISGSPYCVGSLGKYPNERDVSGLVVKDCTVTGTTNGIRIKTWANSPGSSAATNMTCLSFTGINGEDKAGGR